ncbi:MAG TPA: family 20 glycosylhydrolase [Bryobacteraceae bacterium]|nr:family 20 glycosylhydrolase [Bryobacteraceae bacterium]
MRRRQFLQSATLAPLSSAAASASPGMPLRGLHLAAPRPENMELAQRFFEEVLPKEGVNTLFLEFNYGFRNRRFQEIVDEPALSPEQVRSLARAVRNAGAKLVPQINLLGHQSWAKKTFALLRAHPEFDESPGLYPENEGIYCRSYCPRHPNVHEVVLALVDDLCELCDAHDFHAGLDEVFLLAEDACPRCRGANKADLFAAEVQRIHDHLARSGTTLWMWADRFLDGATTGIGKWEASLDNTHTALPSIPKDVIMCDWHYEAAHPTAIWFALHGFRTASCPWRKASVALRQLDQIQAARRDASGVVAGRLLGMIQTTWVGFTQFAKAYSGDKDASPQAREAAACFRELFKDLRRS